MYNRRCWKEWLNYIVKLTVVSRHMWHTCLPNVSQNHVIRPIGWFKFITNLRHHVSLKSFFWTDHVRIVLKCFSVESLIIVLLNT